MKHDIRILVSGASVAGLSVAYWLCRYGFSVTVVERASHLRPGGQALDVRGPAVQVAERMAILAAIRDRGTKLAGMSIVDAEGKEVFRTTKRTMTGGRLDSPDVEILRDDLCDVLYEAVGDQAEYLFEDSIASLSQDASGVDVTFAHAAPRRFDLVIGADGLHSGVRRLVFGPERQFIHHLGRYIAVFSIPNFLGLDRWEVIREHGNIFCCVLGVRGDAAAKAYIGFEAAEPPDYDYRDITAQKQWVAQQVAGAGWEFPRIVEEMWKAPNFHFDGASQVELDSWSRGRVVLLGDAGYSISPSTGQGTTVAMVGAYVLAGELAADTEDLLAGIARYERELRDYVIRNQELAVRASQERAVTRLGDPTGAGIPNFGGMVQRIALKDYPAVAARRF